MNQTFNNKTFNNQSIKRLILALPLTFALTGCVIVADKGNYDGELDWNSSNSSSEWKQVQKSNKANIATLEIGTSLNDVKTKMGTPNINEAFTENNQQYQVLFYRTRHKHSDGETTKDESTPLIFVDGKLQSWGQKAYKKL